jgi:galactonate dehydratase
MEDMIQPDSADDLARLAQESRVPHAVSERLFTKYAFRNVLEKKAAHIVMLDIVWTGGITESKKIATMADAYHLSVAPHDCTGPITVFASLHLCANASNVLIMEMVRGFYEGYYKDVMTNPLIVTDGYIEFSDLPGLGTALQPEFKQRADVYSRITK